MEDAPAVIVTSGFTTGFTGGGSFAAGFSGGSSSSFTVTVAEDGLPLL